MTENRVCWALKDTEDTIELVLLHSPHFAFHKQPTCVPPWISRIIHDIVCFVWDASLTVINIITPKKKTRICRCRRMSQFRRPMARIRRTQHYLVGVDFICETMVKHSQYIISPDHMYKSLWTCFWLPAIYSWVTVLSFSIKSFTVIYSSLGDSRIIRVTSKAARTSYSTPALRF